MFATTTRAASKQQAQSETRVNAAAQTTHAAATHARGADFSRIPAGAPSFWSTGAARPDEPVWDSPPPAPSTPPVQPAQQPAPAPAPNPCATAFTGVTFAVTGATGAALTPGASARFAVDANRNPVVDMRARGPVSYTPTVTITAPSAAVAANYQAGLIQNVLSSDRRAIYVGPAVVHTRPSTAPPLKDGAPRSSGMYDDDFAENGTGHPNILGTFTASGSSVSLVLPDAPGGPAWLDLMDDPAWHPPWAGTKLDRFVNNDTFRTWVGVRHIPTGCVRTIHHIDWNTNWDLDVTVPAFGGAPSATFTTNVNDVTTANGNGSPAYIRGGPVPADGITREVLPP